MSIAYFDCFSGVAGDMVLGALLDAGMPLSYLKKNLALLPIKNYEIKVKKNAGSISGINLNVDVSREPDIDDYKSLDAMIASSSLKKNVSDHARAIFKRLAEAEGRVHGVPISKVHFHEVGAVDSIIDVVGAAIGFDYFKFDAIFASPLPLTRGKIKCAHGILPCPAPATLELMKGIPLEASKIPGEIVTPTGAAILATTVCHFGECPLQKIEKTGYGFGDRVIPGHVNALRLMIGEGFPTVVIEADIDDMNPQMYDHAIKEVLGCGAVEANLMAVQTKKDRPAIRFSVISPWNKKDKIMDVILKETTTFGVRFYPVERRVLIREFVQEKIKAGSFAIKIGKDTEGKILKAMPEYEDVIRLAKKTGRSPIDVYREALVVCGKLMGA